MSAKTDSAYKKYVVFHVKKKKTLSGSEVFKELEKLIFKGKKTNSVDLIRKQRGYYD